MPRAPTSTTACPECGRLNRGDAKFCGGCAVRLGAEPSIASRAEPLPDVDGRRAQSRFDAPRTVFSQPGPLGRPPADSAGFWFKFCLAGLVVMLGFIGWSLYVLTGNKAVPQVPLGQGERVAPPVAAVPASSPPDLAPKPAAAVRAAPSNAPWVITPPTQPAQPSAAAGSRVAATAPASRRATEGAARPVPQQRRVATGERLRAAPSLPPELPPTAGAWVEPSRAPAMTSSPTYRDAGPPVVRGPGPVEPAAVAATPSVPTGSSTRGAGPASQDLGPPITAGPGPRYDYSTPSAASPAGR